MPASVAPMPAFCFAAPPVTPAGRPLALRIDDRTAEALAMLVPVLGCGEEAAALAFDGLAAARARDAAALRAIGAEERVHDALLKQVAASLPPPARDLRRSARRFHIDLGRGGPALHLARIAAIDAAVCTIFSRLIRPQTGLARDPALRTILARIHRDEARHVRVSRSLARATMSRCALQACGAATRAAMAATLAPAADAFEALRVDPDHLLRDVARLPDGLFA